MSGFGREGAAAFTRFYFAHLISEIRFLFVRFLSFSSFSVVIAGLWYHMSVIPLATINTVPSKPTPTIQRPSPDFRHFKTMPYFWLINHWAILITLAVMSRLINRNCDSKATVDHELYRACALLPPQLNTSGLKEICPTINLMYHSIWPRTWNCGRNTF